MMATCTFDNPCNLTRECYASGRLVYHLQLQAMLQSSPPPPGRVFFGANVGPWSSGRLNGSICALPASLWPFVVL